MNPRAQSRSEAVSGDSEDAAGPRARHVRSFALRRGHVTSAQRRAYETLFPQVAVPFARAPLDLDAVFGRRAPCVVEIGFGMGETTAAIAAQNPDINFLAIEVFVAGIGALARRIDDQHLRNLRIVQHDAIEVVREMLLSETLAGVHIFFPDPWPKTRHHKRRLVAQPFVGELAERIRLGGYLHCATDWEPYAEQMRQVLSAEPRLANRHADFAPQPRNPLMQRPTTKFHARGTRLGHGVWDLVFERR
jgi:tRNA (guanine-N7-)-methyltransferase